MQTLILAADAALADDLAAAWRAGGTGSVDAATLPALPSGGTPAVVFVPLGALGLTAAPAAVAPAEARLRELVAGADLVVVHLDALDGGTLHDGVLLLVARVAGERALPVVVLAGSSDASRREWSGAGVSGVHEVGPGAGPRAAAVERVARTWAPDEEQRSRAR